MCLYANNTKPLTLDKDITVYKVFVREGKHLVSPYQETRANYGENMFASGNMPNLPDDYSSNKIGQGAIHSYIDMEEWFIKISPCIKATIKAGVPFFVSFDGKEIASRELQLSEESENSNYPEIIMDGLAGTRETIINLLRSQDWNISANGVKVGDVLLSDKTFLSPDEITSDNCSQAIGIVSFIHPEDGTPHIISLKQEPKKWSNNETDKVVNYVDTYERAVKDFNGKYYTDKLKEAYKDDLEMLPALDYCLKYKTDGTNEGDWFFPSTGEILQTVRNSLIINETIEILNKKSDDKAIADKMTYGTFYWASAEGSQTGAWLCNTQYAHCYGLYDKWFRYYVRPSLAVFNNL